jgi:hypothetical protein
MTGPDERGHAPELDESTVDSVQPADSNEPDQAMVATAAEDTAGPDEMPMQREMPPKTEDVEASAHNGQNPPAEREVDSGAAPDLWPTQKMTALRERWQEVQVHFVDDPHDAAAEADSLVGEAIQALFASLDTRRRELAGWRGGTGADTERLRVAVQGYRGLLDRLLAL